MEGIEHKMVNVNGINMHVAEKGEGPVILFLHGFPELWYTWRHQITAFAALGYRAVAPDLRGYGDSDAPDSIASYSCLHIVADIVALIQSLGVEEVFVVAHDLGAFIAWYLCMFRPEMVKAYVCLTVPFRPRNPKMKPIQTLRSYFGEDYYMCRFQEEGVVEAEIAKHGSKAVLKKILSDRIPGPPRLPKDNLFGILPNTHIKLPSWLSEEDLKYYAGKYDQKGGFTGGLNYYRALDLYDTLPLNLLTSDTCDLTSTSYMALIERLGCGGLVVVVTLSSLLRALINCCRNWELTGPWTGVQVKVPVKFIVGDLDMTYTTPGTKEYVHGGSFKRDVPFLEEAVVMEGVGHFINQERAEEINAHIHDFVKKF